MKKKLVLAVVLMFLGLLFATKIGTLSEERGDSPLGELLGIIMGACSCTAIYLAFYAGRDPVQEQDLKIGGNYIVKSSLEYDVGEFLVILEQIYGNGKPPKIIFAKLKTNPPEMFRLTKIFGHEQKVKYGFMDRK